jgi:hypothetical protein
MSLDCSVQYKTTSVNPDKLNVEIIYGTLANPVRWESGITWLIAQRESLSNRGIPVSHILVSYVRAMKKLMRCNLGMRLGT